MPLLIPGAPVPPSAGDPSDLDIRVAVTLEQGSRTLELTGWVQSGAEGLDDPEFRPMIRRQAGVPGGVVTGVDVPPRRVALDVMLSAASGAGLLALRRAVGDVTDPYTDTRVWVTTTAEDIQETRVITGRRVVESPPVLDRGTWGAWGWQLLGLDFDCADPWWRTVDGWQPPKWATGGTGGFFSDHFFPVTVLPSTAIGVAAPVTVPGNVPTPAVWTLDGPGTAWTVTDTDSGRTWTMNVASLPRPVRVVTGPSVSSVTDGTGADQWTRLAPPYDLWPVPPGDGHIRVDVVGATSETVVTASADALHWRALS